MDAPEHDNVSKKATERYRRVIENIDTLPSLPTVVVKLLEVVNSPFTSADDARRLIERDPALTSRFIRMANSAFYGMPRTVSSVSGAVVILGFNVIRSVVLSASIMKMFSNVNRQAIDKERFWNHSITAAMAAKELVRYLMRFKLFDPETAFCAGILHDIGKLIFNEFVDGDYREAADYARKKELPMIAAESQVLGINHAEIGRILADKWALPIGLEQAIVFHHDPAKVEGEIVDLVNIVHMADLLAHDIGADLWEHEVRTAEWGASREMLHRDDDAYAMVKDSCVAAMANSAEYLSIIG
jgi:putative nucleotidyltransferase with HDIG domain